MRVDTKIDMRLIEVAESKGVAVLDGKTDTGRPILILVATGENVSLLKKQLPNILMDYTGG